MYRKLGTYFFIGVAVPIILYVTMIDSAIDGPIATIVRAIFIVACPGYVLSVVLFGLEASHWIDVAVGSALNGLAYVGIVVLLTRLPKEPAWYRPVAILSGVIIWTGGLFLLS